MGAFALGRDAASRGAEEALATYAQAAAEGGVAPTPPPPPPPPEPRNTLLEIVGRVVRYIPGDVIVIFSAGVALYLADNKEPHWWLIVAGVVAAPLFVIGGAFSRATDNWLSDLVLFRSVAAPIAFLIWSFTVPASPWNQWDAVGDNDVVIVIVAAILGGLFSLFADGFDRRLDGSGSSE